MQSDNKWRIIPAVLLAYGEAVLIIKTFHVFFVVSWFACLFYLPRLFVNHAINQDTAQRALLLGMEARLIKMMNFTLVGTIISAVLLIHALASSAWLTYIQQGWFLAKMVLVLLLIFYHHWCIRIHRRFQQNQEQRSHVWFRVFNEMPVFVLFAVIYLVLAKPF